MTSSDALWHAVQSRDEGADGTFVYAVQSTGIYCRPTCPSRRPLRGNTIFFDTSEQAVKAGFRACRRCTPDTGCPARERRQALERARDFLSASPDAHVQDAAAIAGLSKFHFQRAFRSAFGIAPAAYSRQARLLKLEQELRTARSVTEAVYEAGFNSSARGYESTVKAIGMTPGEYRKFGEGLAIGYATARCFLGTVLVASTPRGICSIALGDSAEALIAELHSQFPQAQIEPGDPSRAKAAAAHIDDPGRPLQLDRDVCGTPFQRTVWAALARIAPGTTVSYSELARSLGRPSAARAVARACATNPLAVVVPCHRVVTAAGAISGYRWGVDRKRQLLEREAGTKPLTA